MARPLRRIIPGELYHVVNRGNDKRVIFREDADYEHFVRLLIRGRERADVTLHGFSLMSTHFHLLAQPMSCDALSSFMHWVTGCYACDLRKSTATVGFASGVHRSFRPLPTHRTCAPAPRWMESLSRPISSERRKPVWAASSSKA